MSNLSNNVESPGLGKVLGLNTPVKVGLRVQLTEKGKAGFDEQLNEFAGPDGRGRITTLMNDGLICAVKWDKNPDEEHFYRTGGLHAFVIIALHEFIHARMLHTSKENFGYSKVSLAAP